jgi:hypothetical protein
MGCNEPKECRQLSTWRHVEALLNAAAKGGDARNASVSLMMVLQIEGVPYTVK